MKCFDRLTGGVGVVFSRGIAGRHVLRKHQEFIIPIIKNLCSGLSSLKAKNKSFKSENKSLLKKGDLFSAELHSFQLYS